MNKTKIEWVKNPDGTQGYTWNPITGCLNGCEYCYARKLANRRLKSRYLANQNIAPIGTMIKGAAMGEKALRNPFHPRFWPEKLAEIQYKKGRHLFPPGKQKGIFVCDMSDLFGIGVPEEWTKQVMSAINRNLTDRFYLLTKQPQNLIQWSPFPENAWVGVTATDGIAYREAIHHLYRVEAKRKFISFEPLLQPAGITDLGLGVLDWVIIGSQTKPYKPPKIEWVREIVEACDRAGIPVFLKNNLYPLIHKERTVADRKIFGPDGPLRQELPK